jgi:DNA polymerase-3 subunit epsilon
LTVWRRRPWRASRFLVVDVETTGLDPRRDEIVSFAALPVEAGRIVLGGAVAGLVRPKLAPPPRSVEIHGLRTADLAEAPEAAVALAPLAGALRDRVPVAHAAWVERAFLGPPLRSLGARLPRSIVDTALLWRLLSITRGDGDPGTVSLGTLAAELRLPVHRPHEADGDTLTTAQAFLALATHLEAHGRGTLRALLGARWYLRGWRMVH